MTAMRFCWLALVVLAVTRAAFGGAAGGGAAPEQLSDPRWWLARAVEEGAAVEDEDAQKLVWSAILSLSSRSGDAATARHAASRLAGRGPDPYLHDAMGRALARSGDVHAAQGEWRRAVAAAGQIGDQR